MVMVHGFTKAIKVSIYIQKKEIHYNMIIITLYKSTLTIGTFMYLLE